MLSRRSSGCFGKILWIGVLLFVGYLFRNEIILLWQVLRELPDVLYRRPTEAMPPLADIVGVLSYMGFNLVIAMGFSYVLLYMMAEFVLPTRNSAEQWQVLSKLLRFMRGKPTPVLIVREAKLTREVGGGGYVGNGVAIVDINSAIVLEKVFMPYHLSTEKASQYGWLPRYPMARVGGPGLVFIHRGEKLRGLVSLRKQFRVNPGVLANTIDGIEIKTNVWVMFTLGQPAAIIKVAYVTGDTAADLRVLNIDPQTRKILSISDELDQQDKEEIHAYAQEFLSASSQTAQLEPLEKGKDHPPYHIDPDRIIAAVFSQARNVSDSQLDSWADIPVQEATELFRQMLSKTYYDALYSLEDTRRYPLLSEFKPDFGRRMRYLGVVSYQFLQRYDGEFPDVGQRIEHRSFYISPVQELRSSKSLRDRGIKVIAAGFSELSPTDPGVQQQRIDTWRANWQKESDLLRAEIEREVVRLRAHARAERQGEIISQLTRILQSSVYSDEAVTLQILQTLEDVAIDPHTRPLLPNDTIHLIHGLRAGLLPDEGDHPALGSGDIVSPDPERSP